MVGMQQVFSDARAQVHAHELDDTTEIARRCADFVTTAGPAAALRFLNERTRFRFTGVYCAEPPLLRNVHLYDRENPALNVSGAVTVLADSYCAIVCAGEPFLLTDSRADGRIAIRAAREGVRSYCGVPIRLDSGHVWGSLCHFDVRPRFLPASELALLIRVASCFAPRVTEQAITR